MLRKAVGWCARQLGLLLVRVALPLLFFWLCGCAFFWRWLERWRSRKLVESLARARGVRV